MEIEWGRLAGLLAMGALILATIYHDSKPVRFIWRYVEPLAEPLSWLFLAAMVLGTLTAIVAIIAVGFGLFP